MSEFLLQNYLTIKALHIISIICWMAGLFYLPRLYVYHTKAKVGSELDQTLQVMEKKLLKLIMNPSMIASFVFGILLIYIIGFESGKWLHAKILLVLIMALTHGLMAKYRKDFATGKNTKGDKFYRVLNEVPTILMVIIVFLAITKPF
ncbi:coproporphyrinogen III oxidase [endosymbiont of Acanthamoeba sp. UWC8]|uniref:protoporphyrinogen oxidase HemJ n=1 Tax=endosymbiont of Acanthamoeba sp. UWC8 TaxID=86106 RepID=UPI0004D12C66|nr:protoporphyrinogen oxidase HemJ [endosymbiont of Acanthamoeba sp. UWC8]AIF81937.1 coproporphyrinogen III oxidase [endosymbiont of Acanthamoeba sp. UWC8]